MKKWEKENGRLQKACPQIKQTFGFNNLFPQPCFSVPNKYC